MICTFNAQNQSPAVLPDAMPELHPTIAGICRSFNQCLSQQNSCENTHPVVAVSKPPFPGASASAATDSCYPEAIRFPVTVGTNVRHPENIGIRDISYVMDAIRQGFYEGYNLKKAVEVIRGMTDKEAQKSAKSTLPWFCGSVIKERRSNANVVKSSFMIFDLDHVKDIEGTKQKAISKFPWIRYGFHSVTDGVKLVAMMNKPITDESKYRAIYEYLRLQIETLLRLPCDHTPDRARACFMSYDPDLLDNFHNLKPLDTGDYYRQAISFRELRIGLATSQLPKQTQSVVAVSKPPFPGQLRIGLATSQLPKQTQSVVAVSKPPFPGASESAVTDDYAKASKIVQTLSKIHLDRQDWIKTGFALYAAFGERGKPLWDMFVDNPNYNDTQRIIDIHWNSFRNVRSITLSSLFYIADKYGVRYE